MLQYLAAEGGPDAYGRLAEVALGDLVRQIGAHQHGHLGDAQRVLNLIRQQANVAVGQRGEALYERDADDAPFEGRLHLPAQRDNEGVRRDEDENVGVGHRREKVGVGDLRGGGN